MLSYDSYGRVTVEDYPGAGIKTINYYDTARPRYTITRLNSGRDTYSYIDGLDRPLQTTIRGEASAHKTTRQYYDGASRLYYTAGPFFTAGYGYYTGAIPSGAPYSDMNGDFDFLNRPTRIARPHDDIGEAVTTISYNGFNRTITDPDSKATTETRDYLGRIQSITDAISTVTAYDYNGAGDLTQVTDSMKRGQKGVKSAFDS